MSIQNKKILFLPAWYPERNHPIAGIFIKKHAIAVAKFYQVAVLYVTFDPYLQTNTIDVDISRENHVLTVRIYFGKGKIRLPLFRSIANIFFQYYLWAKGFNLIRKHFGKPNLIHVQVIPFLKTTVLPTPLLLTSLLFYMKKFRKIPYMVTEHSTIYTDKDGRYEAYSRFFKRTVKHLCLHAEALTTVSENLLNSLKKHGITHPKSYIISNVIEIPAKVTRQVSHRIRMLSVSLLDDTQKNISGIIKAFHHIHQMYENTELLIIGDGKDKDKLIELAKSFSLYDKSIFFLGYVPNAELSAYFFSANFFVLNSNFETFSVATAEAIAHGVPVIATKCGGPEEFVTDEVGILIEPNNQHELIQAMEYMINHWHRFQPEKLRKFIAERFSLEVVGKKFANLYDEILGTKSN